ncbi:hypothetical protein [Pricia sp.]|uniref:hypothetical protein n=1 Tax=Pricia sp. TaxID=2268138 RepID=UPI00359417C6
MLRTQRECFVNFVDLYPWLGVLWILTWLRKDWPWTTYSSSGSGAASSMSMSIFSRTTTDGNATGG